MSVPKSVVKIKKKGIEYVANFDAAEYFLHELSRAALRDVGKFTTRRFREAFYANFKRRTGKAGRATRYEVISNARTTAPRVKIGITNQKTEGFYAYFQEFGTSHQKKLGLLTKTVQDNIAEIVKIESMYLSGLSEEAKRLEAMIDERDYEGDADED